MRTSFKVELCMTQPKVALCTAELWYNVTKKYPLKNPVLIPAAASFLLRVHGEA